MATYAIGDIQGCYETFQSLLQRIDFDPAVDRLWLAGDLVNRGPESAAVLRWARAHDHCVISVLGNHDLHLLGLAGTDGRHRKHDTLDSVLQASDRDELIDWLRRRPMVHHEPPHLLVHAGLLPWWSPAEALQLSAEIGQALRDGRGERLLAAHESKEMPAWSASLEGHERWMSALQAFANLRFCDREGHARFGVKVAPQDAPRGLTPWFDFPGRRTASQVVVCGHWAAMGLHIRDDLLALDTGCVWGGSLTAIRLEDRAVVQEPCQDPVPRARPG